VEVEVTKRQIVERLVRNALTEYLFVQGEKSPPSTMANIKNEYKIRGIGEALTEMGVTSMPHFLLMEIRLIQHELGPVPRSPIARRNYIKTGVSLILDRMSL